MINVALPTIQRDLAFNSAGLAWVVDAYLITFGGFLLLGGRMGDLLGRKRLLLAGLILFTVASLLCGLSSNQGELVAGRFVQGVGAALLVPNSLALLNHAYPDEQERGRAVGPVLARRLDVRVRDTLETYQQSEKLPFSDQILLKG